MDSIDFMDVVFRAEQAMGLHVTVDGHRKVLHHMRPELSADHLFDTSDIPEATVRSLSAGLAHLYREVMERQDCGVTGEGER